MANSLILTLLILAAVLAWAADNGQAQSTTDVPPQEMLSLPVRVVDADGQPVKGVVVIPWALRCSQGHGSWRVDGFGRSAPPTLITDADGRVDVPYPRYCAPEERVRTTEVTISLDHPEFAYISHEYITVVPAEPGPHQTALKRGAIVELLPLQDGRPAPLDNVYALWSDGRSSQSGVSPSVTADGALRLPRMPAGKGQVLLAKMKGERVTHFSSIVDVDLDEGDEVRKEVELRPAVRIEGTLSRNVPRPVENGRISAWTLPNDPTRENVRWITWSPIAEEGTFVIDAWPVVEDIQIIALCDGFIAESGDVPDVAKDRPHSPSFQWPQVFSSTLLSQPIELRMTPTIRCVVETVDEHGVPVAGVKIEAWPNVCWWNEGSQIYCAWLSRSEKYLANRGSKENDNQQFATPFQGTTDDEGHAELELPAVTDDLYAEHDKFELPVVRGRREQKIRLVQGQTALVRLVMQPKGSEYLGEWDKLAGVLFGCTGEECRRLLEDPGFRTKMIKVGKQFDEAANPTDPAVLKSAYAEIAAAFDELKDQEEAAIWRRKADEQAAKLNSASGEAGAPAHR